MQETNENTQQVLIEPEQVLPDFTFDQLPPAMREPLIAMGWRTPMPVQAKAIPYLMDKRDMIVQSRTGSGKTGAFLMPLLMRMDPGKRYPQALVLIPTRELAMQVFKELETLSQGMPVSSALLYGGVGYGTQLQALRDGAQVIIGTPGRVLDHIGRRSLNVDRLSIIVFDEADEMLSMGFYPDMRELRRYLPRERSSWMFSATMPYKVQMLAREFLREPEFLSLSAGNIGVSTMEHRYYDVPPLEKDLMLMRLIEFEHPESAIVFCNTKVDVEYLTTVLRNYGYNVEQLSGDLDQKSRERAMESIRRGETRFLVATDVAARGIDISDLSHVFQYDVPKDPDSYIHRAGRTARAGNTGVVITLVANMSEKSDLKKISRKYNIDFVEMPMPTQEELETRMAERLVVILEDRQRTLSRLVRERMKRFNAVVQSLAENEDERGLLAMLLDEVYQTAYHQPVPSGAPAVEPPRQQQPRPSQGDRPSQSERAPQADRAPQGDRASQSDRSSQNDRPSQNERAAGEDIDSDEAERRKKKRRRKKKKNRGGGEQQGQGQQNTPGPEMSAQRGDQRNEHRGSDSRSSEARPKDDRPQGEQRENTGREGARPREDRREQGRPAAEPRENVRREEGRREGAREADGNRRSDDREQRGGAPRGDRNDRDRGRGDRDRKRSGLGEPQMLDFGARESSLVESIEVIEPDPPTPVQPAKPEPSKQQPAKAEPVKQQPAKAQPVKPEPAPAEAAPEPETAGSRRSKKSPAPKQEEPEAAKPAAPKRTSRKKEEPAADAEVAAPAGKRGAKAAPPAESAAPEAPAKRATKSASAAKETAKDEAAEPAKPARGRKKAADAEEAKAPAAPSKRPRKS